MFLSLLTATLRLWTPLALAAMGGVLSERAGVVNIALEAMMLAGCFASVAAARATGSAFVGVLAGIAAGAFVGLLHALFTQKLRVAHILSGVALNLGLLGFTTYAATFATRSDPSGTMDTKATVPDWVTTTLAFAAVGALFFVLSRTALGLRLRASGENPAAARAAGVDVSALRYGAVIASGALAGLAGVALALAGLGAFRPNMTAGRGYVALAAVIFGRWNPLGAALAALVFALGDALQQALQTDGRLHIPPDFLTLLPYILTLLALAFMNSKNVAPAALGVDEAG